MKSRITVSISEELDLKLREKLRQGAYIRNKSHLVEVAIKEFLERGD